MSALPASAPDQTAAAIDRPGRAAAHGDDPLVARAWDALEAVPDPEIPVVSIRELGILRDVRRAAGGMLEVVITPTYSGCPAMQQIAEDIDAALRQAGVAPHRTVTVLAPAWTTDWITADAREKLRAYGIAPPVGHCGSVGDTGAAPAQRVVRFMPKPLAAPVCPRCGSAHTERLAQFASTACKALYRCVDCREPFDYFKPY
ncbi:1,2-phenylacetyl-CoA epoxidase subunit PaaD [Burkholderia oklahomensis]|uniref:1,2-phenylacetyl-CoA epoxidase subunit PaaD n=1 Tax=Burkholderia oklahomensis TaxID=342113 RepID=UPI00016A8681|nr:1,2-phenylacetyl-CoA epoxidase subunit PaaD [Burkholderia oklahomensis]AJX33504.1 phenylacetate-CoA oxygenase, PaaJ subunit [Burkholderia oklahomensis C6786]AOI44569.1 phenylacetate-CoA oxygenase subunit PaaJ [Burkholderia oklahomensis C6786]KUY54844.1 phenylacetate-CoA oxygenase subunit PaaJ [Burkholderia oklahomensis C6786]MBI0359430.1 phenylacetate-CoA oxygenase subunit PaaJ [Burkholderia oklahomensis]SUW58511.1 phenylacetate-CoA oxygenase, PaaJ subunit [Burkholderia oklahomensis]